MSGLSPRTRPAQGRCHGHVVLVHGTLDESAGFRPLLERLRDWDVTTYDRRGWGRSAELDAAGLQSHVEDLLALLPGEQVILAGHSHGGTIALAAAARRPDLVRAVVAYEPPLPWLPWWPERAPWERIVLDEQRDPPDAAEALMRGILGDEGWERLPERLREKRRGEGHLLHAEMRALTEDPPGFDPLDIEPPVIAAAGSASLPHHRRVSARLADLVHHGRYLELEGAGHPAHVTHPAEFAGLLSAAGRLAARDPEAHT